MPGRSTHWLGYGLEVEDDDESDKGDVESWRSDEREESFDIPITVLRQVGGMKNKTGSSSSLLIYVSNYCGETCHVTTEEVTRTHIANDGTIAD